MSYNVEYQIAQELSKDLEPNFSLEEEYEFPIHIQERMIRAIKLAANASEENENFSDSLGSTMFEKYKTVLLRLLRAFNYMELGLFDKALNQIQFDDSTTAFLKVVAKDVFEFLYEKASED